MGRLSLIYDSNFSFVNPCYFVATTLGVSWLEFEFVAKSELPVIFLSRLQSLARIDPYDLEGQPTWLESSSSHVCCIDSRGTEVSV